MRRMSLVAACALSTLFPRVAHATYSIVATDSATGQVGGAGTSCVGANLSVYIIYGSAPGKGVVAAQAAINTNGRNVAVQQLNQGVAPADIIQAITASSFDSGSSSRQYGIVDLQGRSDGFTGSTNGNFAGDRQGKSGANYTYSTQGNILTSKAVIDQAATAFEGQGCDLADKLMLALEAGGKNGQGDSRCSSRGIPSDGAFIQVDLSSGKAGSFLKLQVDNTKSQNPLTLLRAQFDTWRASNPCGSTGGAGGSGGMAGAAGMGGGSGTGGTAGAGTMGVGGSAGMGVGGSSGSTGGSGPGVGGASGSGGASSGGASGAAGGGVKPFPSTEEDSGCGCRTTQNRGLPWTASAMLGLALLARRRRARPRR